MTLPFFVEIVGVAGSGKSTLARTLSTPNGTYGLAPQMRLRDPQHLSYVLRGVPGLLPLVSHPVGLIRLSWTELKLLLYLASWDRFIRAASRVERDVVIADQGPVYALARLETLTTSLTASARYQRWWEMTAERWSRTVDLVVWLDAADEALEARINDREQGHDVKGGSARDVRAFIKRYRTAYARVTGAFQRSGGPSIFRFDTGRIGPAALAARVGEVIRTAADVSPVRREPDPP